MREGVEKRIYFHSFTAASGTYPTVWFAKYFLRNQGNPEKKKEKKRKNLCHGWLSLEVKHGEAGEKAREEQDSINLSVLE